MLESIRTAQIRTREEDALIGSVRRAISVSMRMKTEKCTWSEGDDERCGTERRNTSEKVRGWGLIYRPEYAHADDGLGELMTHECLIYADQGKVFADEDYQPKNFRIAKAKSRDVRRRRIL